jgi:hypothetical protein
MAAATSWLLLVESVDDVPLVLDVLEVLLPVAPICERASMIELIRPPPCGGGGGGDASELTSDVLVVSGKVLLVLLVVSSWASQLLMLEMLLIVMSSTPARVTCMSIQHKRRRDADL